MVILCLSFWGATKLFFTAASPFYILHMVELFLFPNSWCEISSLSPLYVGFVHLPLGVDMAEALELPCDSPAFVLFPLPQGQCIPNGGCSFGTQNSNRAAADSQSSCSICENELIAVRTETLAPLVTAAKQPDTPFIPPFTLVLFYVFISFICQIPLHMLLPLSKLALLQTLWLFVWWLSGWTIGNCHFSRSKMAPFQQLHMVQQQKNTTSSSQAWIPLVH